MSIGALSASNHRDQKDSLPDSDSEDHLKLVSESNWWLRHRFSVPIVSIVIFLSIWEIIGSMLNPITLATPSGVVRAFIDAMRSGVLEGAFVTAMEDFLTGYVLAVVIGISLGVLMGRSRIAERALGPYISFFQAMPSIAAIPLLVIWFGVGFQARVVTTFWLAFLPVLINTYSGLRTTPKTLREVAKIYHLSEFATIKRVALPGALPFIFAGLRRAVGLGMIGMLIAEMEISVKGLGGLITTYGDDLQTAYLLAGICLAAIVGVIGVALIELSRRLLFPWIDELAGQEHN